MAIAIVHAPKNLDVFTYEDYLQLPDNGKRYEIIDGELYMSPAPNLGHQDAVGEVHLTTPLLPRLEIPLDKVFGVK
jgi:hypothetical protein